MNRVLVVLAALLISVNGVYLPLLSDGGEGDHVMNGNRGDRDPRNGSGGFFFDFGDTRSPVMAGYTGVTPEDTYSEEMGWGLLSDPRSRANTSSYFHNRGFPERYQYVLPRSWVYNTYKDDLTVDGLRSQENVSFRVDLPNGSYRIKLWLGDLEQAVYSMNISCNDQWLLERGDAFHIGRRSFYLDWEGDYPYDYGMPTPYYLDVNVTDGKLIINITGNDDDYWQDLAAELAKDPPCSYIHEMSTGGKKCSTGTGPWQYIGGPFTNASVMGIEVYPTSDLPLNMSDGVLRYSDQVENGILKLGVVWFNENELSEAYVSWLLTGVSNLTGADLVARAQLGMYIVGSLHGDYELDILDETVIPGVEDDLEAALVEDPGNITLRDLLDDVIRMRQGLKYEFERILWDPDPRNTKNHFYEADKAAMLLWTIGPDSPLYPKARLWTARCLMNLDPHRWTSASGTALIIMEELKLDFPDNPYLKFYTETVRHGVPTWDSPTEVISTTGEKDEWNLTDYNADFMDAPKWARQLREELCWLYDVTDWWVDHRMQENGYLGGGWTDDVEYIGLFGFDALISEGADDKSLEAAGRFTTGMLEEGGVDPEKGFSEAFADTEHSAELTGDSLPMMIATDFGNPQWIEFSYKTAALMRDLWMGENDLGFLQFKGNHLSATKVGTGGQAEDSWINFRAALPAFWVWWYNRDPGIEELLVRWADAWVNASLSTAKGKPEGVIPAMIAWPTGEIGGADSPNWYQGARNDGSVNYDFEDQLYKDYLSTLLATAYEATGDTSYLEPLKLEADIAQDYLDDRGGREPEIGSGKWAGAKLGQKAVDRYQAVLDRYVLPGAHPSAALWTRESVVDATVDGHAYIENNYPLMTTEASATDRVGFIGMPNPFLIFTGGSIGGALLTPQFTYTGLQRDFAAMVQQGNRTDARILLYGFYQGEREAGIVPWELESGAQYILRSGPDTDGDSVMDSVGEEFSFTFTSRGMEVPFTLPGKQEYLVTIEKTGDGSGITLLPDPAFGSGLQAPRTGDPVVDRENGTVTVEICNLGGSGVEDVIVELIAFDGEGENRGGEGQSQGSGKVIARGMADIPAPSGFQVPIITVVLQIIEEPPESGSYLLVIDRKGALQQITTRNDEQEVSLELQGSKVHPYDEGGEGDDEEEGSRNVGLLAFLVGVLVIQGASILCIEMWYPKIGSK